MKYEVIWIETIYQVEPTAKMLVQTNKTIRSKKFDLLQAGTEFYQFLSDNKIIAKLLTLTP